MKTDRPVYLIDSIDLDKILRDIIKSEFKILEERLMKEPRILSRTEAAKFIGVSSNTVSEYVKRGLIPNRGNGRKIMILESDLTKVSRKRGYTHWNNKD